ncbi:hypothetical protein DAEQUDRAFT_720670 [Daedalea quercina L-15889]|uniref:Ferritin-like domain-containing protein n=1 Tax=Daedalea quercina L-15889 TaxID=1314783 RepID=A0A165U775_9APHY|nr:hypothetical protein DAEQUDRAFT_720670 [Daedalea quercina L-15889]
MRPSSSILSLAVPLLVSAAPTSFRRANDADVTVLQFAGVLEDLESQFYSQALSTFQASDFTAAGFTDPNIPIQQFTAIGSDESTHLTTIQDTLQSLGAEAISGCSFNFSSALTSVAAMAPVARTVENVGVAAYLGAAHLITDPSILTAAASIMTIEARHQTILNLVNNATSIPQAFDLAFTPGEVLAAAGSFISGCSTGITANTALTVTNNGSITPGTTLTFSSSALNGNQANIAARYYVGEDAWDEKSDKSKNKNKNKDSSNNSNTSTSSSTSTSTTNSTSSSNSTCSSTSQLFCQIMVGGSSTAMALSIDSCQIPDGLNGPAAVFITCDDTTLPTDVVQRASSQSILAGPAMIFVDTEVDLLAGLSKTGASCETDAIANSTTTTTTAAASTSTATDTTATASTDTATVASTAAASSAATDSTAAAATSTDSTATTATSVDSTAAAATAVTTTINSSLALSIISAAGASATAATTATAAADAVAGSAIANIMYGSVPARR